MCDDLAPTRAAANSRRCGPCLFTGACLAVNRCRCCATQSRRCRRSCCGSRRRGGRRGTSGTSTADALSGCNADLRLKKTRVASLTSQSMCMSVRSRLSVRVIFGLGLLTFSSCPVAVPRGGREISALWRGQDPGSTATGYGFTASNSCTEENSHPS